MFNSQKNFFFLKLFSLIPSKLFKKNNYINIYND